MVTPCSIVAGGVWASAVGAATRAPKRRAAARALRIVTSILFMEQVEIIRDYTVRPCRERALEVGPALHRPREHRCAGGVATLDETRREERMVEHRSLGVRGGEHAADPDGELASQHGQARRDE